MTFTDWMNDLAACASLLYGAPGSAADLEAEDWRSYYDAGMTPEQALNADAWDEEGGAVSERKPSERAFTWLGDYHGSIDSTALLLAFDAGYSEGEKSGETNGEKSGERRGYLAALQELKHNWQDTRISPDGLWDWLDRRIREAEENAK